MKNFNFRVIGMLTGALVSLWFQTQSICFATETTNFDSRIPVYQQMRPLWAFSVSGSLKALGTSPGIPNLGDSKVRAFSMQFELQPQFIQPLGVLGVGPSLNLYPVSPIGGVTRAALGGLWSVGGQVRYQARFFREQPLAPYAGYAMEYWNYRLVDESRGSLTAKGPFFGALLLLNFLDQETAAEFYLDSGVLRSYLVAEIKTLEGQDGLIQLSGRSYYFGLRFEF